MCFILSYKNFFVAKFLLIILIFTFVSCEEKLKPNVVSDLNWDELPSQESFGSHIVFSDSGITRAVLLADHILYYSEKAEYLLNKNVKVDFHNKNGIRNSVLTADSAKIDDKTKNMTAFGNVKVVSDSGTVLTTTEMHWINATRMITGDKFVTISSQFETIQGYGFESDQNLTHYTIKRVSGKVATDNIVK
jgi:LPS export ABC transporter protein LptC